MNDLEVIERFLTVKIKEETTRIAYRYNINLFYKYIQEKNLSLTTAKSWDVDDYAEELRKKYAVATKNQKLSSVKSLYTYLVKNKYVDMNIVNIEFEEIDNVKDEYLNNDEIKLLLNYMINREKIPGEKMFEFQKARDILFVVMAIKTGMRFAELEYLIEDSFDFENMIIKLPKELRKNDSALELIIDMELLKYYNEYMCQREKIKVHHDNIFLSIRGKRLGGEQKVKNSSTVNAIIKKNIENANIYYESIGYEDRIRVITCHKFRHTCGYLLSDNDYTLIQVAKVLGHKSLRSSERYIHASNSDIRKKQFNLL